jgi:N utilization substance protein B
VAVDARHLARERALELLYEADAKGVPARAVIEGLAVSPDAFVLTLVDDAESARPIAEAAIRAASVDWPLERMAVLDRLVMVLAIGEVMGASPPPDAVVLDEAVELAKTYSTEASPRFVNGVLAAVLPSLDRPVGPSSVADGRPRG